MSGNVKEQKPLQGILRLVRFDKSDIRGVINGLRYTVKNTEYDKAIKNLDVNRVMFPGSEDPVNVMDLPVEEDVVASIFSVSCDPELPFDLLMAFTKAALSENVELDEISEYLSKSRTVFQNMDPRYDNYVARYVEHYWPDIRLRVNRDTANMVFTNSGFTIF